MKNMENKKIHDQNERLLSALSLFINNCPDGISSEMVEDLRNDCGFSDEKAYRVLLAGALDLYDDRDMMQNYLSKTVKKLDPKSFSQDPYYTNIKLDHIRSGGWTLEKKSYKPYELFVFDDLKKMPDGRIIPQVGFFDKKFQYPCILQDGREWMLVTPNEINTMKKPIEKAHGRVLTYGLGLGYFAYMASLKENVTSVTVIERDKCAIELFEKHILPQFDGKEKIKVVEFDALFFAAEQKSKNSAEYDFVFADVWHDPSDGCDVYLLLKSLERGDTEYAYWIEDTIKCYL
ncbi:MAG: hypothetical protein E7656_05610 [Ruminococcaceae bacterium]|nr:hypothetical protein [Oscillospiraceae bacterium]